MEKLGQGEGVGRGGERDRRSWAGLHHFPYPVTPLGHELNPSVTQLIHTTRPPMRWLALHHCALKTVQSSCAHLVAVLYFLPVWTKSNFSVCSQVCAVWPLLSVLGRSTHSSWWGTHQDTAPGDTPRYCRRNSRSIQQLYARGTKGNIKKTVKKKYFPIREDLRSRVNLFQRTKKSNWGLKVLCMGYFVDQPRV